MPLAQGGGPGTARLRHSCAGRPRSGSIRSTTPGALPRLSSVVEWQPALSWQVSWRTRCRNWQAGSDYRKALPGLILVEAGPHHSGRLVTCPYPARQPDIERVGAWLFERMQVVRGPHGMASSWTTAAWWKDAHSSGLEESKRQTSWSARAWQSVITVASKSVPARARSPGDFCGWRCSLAEAGRFACSPALRAPVSGRPLQLMIVATSRRTMFYEPRLLCPRASRYRRKEVKLWQLSPRT
jgi:hypothetical protein